MLNKPIYLHLINFHYMDPQHASDMLGKIESLDSIRRDINYTIKQISIKATTVSNSGVIQTLERQYINKCFFIAIVDGFRRNDVNIFNAAYFFNLKGNENNNLFAVKLARKYRMLNNKLIDTEYPYHLRFIKEIASKFSVRFEFYVGYECDTDWYTTPDPVRVIGEGKSIIRIITKGNHFEHLLDNDSIVVDLTKSTINNAICDQEDILNIIKMMETDFELAKRLTEEEELLERQYQKQVENDLEFAKKISITII